jgi:hypothetical protein
MKNFKEYLAESAKSWDFRIKIVGSVDAERTKMLETLLSKYMVSNFKKVGTTPIQDLPLDFPHIKNMEVTIFDITVDYPVTQEELRDYLANGLGATKDTMVVRRPGEPYERYQETKKTRDGVLLDDPNYTEAEKHNFDDYYGDKYNSGFVKELNDILKQQRKARGEVIPSEGKVHYNSEDKTNTRSPIQQAPKVRK